MAIIIRIDWISATDKRGSVSNVSHHPILSDGQWVECTAKNGYTIGQKHSTGVHEYINPTRQDMGRHMVYSGKTLDKIKDSRMINGVELLQYHTSEGHNITRLDLAVDFKGYGLTVEQFTTSFMLGECKTKLRKASVVASLTDSGETLYIGSMKKRKNLVRIYNKGAEQGTDEDWVRVELQIMGKKATSTGSEVARTDTLEETILGLIKGVVDFPCIPVWNLLMSDQLEVKMSSIPKEEGNTEKWLLRSVVPSLARSIVLNAGFWVRFQLALIDELPDDLQEEMVREVE